MATLSSFYGPIKSIQYGTASLSPATTGVNVTITAVDVSKSFLIDLGTNATSGVTTVESSLVKLILNGSTNVNASRGGVGGTTLTGFCVVEFY